MRAFWILFLYERGMEIPHPNIYDDYIRNSKYGTKSKKKKKKKKFQTVYILVPCQHFLLKSKFYPKISSYQTFKKLWNT